MKKWIFILTCFILCCSFDTRVTRAETMNLGEAGTYEFTYTTVTGEENITYHFKFIANGYPISEGETSVFYIDSSGESHFLVKLTTESYETDAEGIWLQSIQKGSIILSNDTDIQCFKVHFYAQYPTVDWTRYEVIGTLQESTTPTITPNPTITPIPTPVLELNVHIADGKAIADYNVNGSTIINSSIELYEVNTITSSKILVDDTTFSSGTGSVSNFIEPGKIYNYRLCCTYEQDGVQQEIYLWSDDLIIEDEELEDYRETGKITNFRTLMLYI